MRDTKAFDKLKWRIVAAIMGVLVALFAGTLAIIYFASSSESYNRNIELLRSYSEQELEEAPFGTGFGSDSLAGEAAPDGMGAGGFGLFGRGGGPGAAERRDPRETPAFKLSTFYSVLLGADGNVMRVDNADAAVVSDDELEEAAQRLASGDSDEGTDGNLVYLVTRADSATLVAFMDVSVANESTSSLLRYTLIFGAVCFVLFFFLALYLANRMVRPLKEAYERERRFVADAGHELKTPISVIGANAELLGRELGENQWLENIVFENERMGQLVRGLLDLEGAGAGTDAALAGSEDTAAPVREHIDLSRLVSGEVLLFEGVAFESGKSITADVCEGVSVMGDSLKLRQMTSILIDNAISHSPDGSPVEVSLKSEKGAAELSVSNAGELSEEAAEHAFDRFYRADGARGADGHYGLGLPIARAIVEAHGGSICATSANGTVTFTVTLPLA